MMVFSKELFVYLLSKSKRYFASHWKVTWTVLSQEVTWRLVEKSSLSRVARAVERAGDKWFVTGLPGWHEFCWCWKGSTFPINGPGLSCFTPFLELGERGGVFLGVSEMGEAYECSKEMMTLESDRSPVSFGSAREVLARLIVAFFFLTGFTALRSLAFKGQSLSRPVSLAGQRDDRDVPFRFLVAL